MLFVEFLGFFLINKSSPFLSSLLATDVKENLLFHELPFALVIGEVSQMEQVAVLEPTLGNGGRGVEDEEQDECLAGMPSFQRIQRTLDFLSPCSQP